MGKFFSSMGQNLGRFRRYTKVWKWFFRYNIKKQCLLFLWVLLLGLIIRLGPLLGFIISVRCATWILNPDSIPSFITSLLSQDSDQFFIPFILIPGCFFLTVAVAQIVESSASLKYRNMVVGDLTQKYSESLFIHHTEEHARHRPNLSAVATDIRLSYGRILSIETIFISIMAVGLSFLLAFMVGLLINWLFMIIVTTIGVIFSLIISINRHLKSHDVVKDQESKRLSEKSSIENFVNLSRTTRENESVISHLQNSLPSLIHSMSVHKAADQKFNSHSKLFMGVGQAVVIMIFLWMLIGSSGSDQAVISKLIVLVLLFRFLLSCLQTMTSQIIKLSVNYPFLVALYNQLVVAKKED